MSSLTNETTPLVYTNFHLGIEKKKSQDLLIDILTKVKPLQFKIAINNTKLVHLNMPYAILTKQSDIAI